MTIEPKVTAQETRRLIAEEKMMSNQLRRQNGIVAGVCGGLGAFFGLSPWLFRIIFLILFIPGGLPGLLPYLLMWLLIPPKR